MSRLTSAQMQELDGAFRKLRGEAPSIRLLYIPWLVSEATEIFHECNRWKTAEETRNRQRTWRIEWSQIDRPCLRDLAATSQIYVQGHSEAGPENLTTLRRKGLSLRYDQVAERMIASGLQETFGGVIKFYACSSGAAAAQVHEPVPSFAKRCADYLRGKGYRNCRYFGYTADVYGEPEKDEWDDYHRFALSSSAEKARASFFQVEV
jgi:hypothetical protein